MPDDSGWEVVQGLYLILSLYHIVVVSIGYTISLIYVFLHKPNRILPLLVAVAIVAFIGIFFWAVFSNLAIADTFRGNRWPSDIFQHWPILFLIDPVLIIFTVWFKLACSVDAMRFVPPQKEVERFRDEYESVKGHRDFIVIYCLRGLESQEDTLASIRAAINSRFPSHRLRILLLFYGESCSVLDRFLRSHLSSEPLDPSLNLAPNETLVHSHGVKISVLRISMNSAIQANLRCLNFLAMAYAEDTLRKPIVCFLSSNIILDEFAIARFVYELDDPRREFITGVFSRSQNEYLTERLSRSIPFWFAIQTRVAEDYCGNILKISGDFLVARFKALNATAAQAFAEFDGTESMKTHRLTLGLIQAKQARHRIGICLGAKAWPASSPARQPLAKQITGRAEARLEQFYQNAEIILQPHILSTSPMLTLLTIGSSLLEHHLYFFIQLFLLERISGRGNALASSYIFLLLFPSYVFIAFAAYRNGDRTAFATVLVNFLVKPVIDVVTDVAICIIFVRRIIRKAFERSNSSDAKATHEMTSAQNIV